MFGVPPFRLTIVAAAALAVAVVAQAQPPVPVPVFTDPVLQARMTPIKAVHITELRQAIDGLRARRGLAVMSWTDPILVPGVTPGRVIHLVELRTALNGVYQADGLPPPVYTNPTAQAGLTMISAVHIAELRSRVAAFWLPPTVTSITPDDGPVNGGTEVVITGTNFRRNAAVKIGTTTADVTDVSATTVTAVTRAGSNGTYGVTVTNREGPGATLPSAFTYRAGIPTFLASIELAFGDSITLGITRDAVDNGDGTFSLEVRETEGYPAKLQRRLAGRFPVVSISVENQGRAGDCASVACYSDQTGAQRLDSLLAGPHDLVIILEGVNDLNGGVSPEVVASALRTMVRNARAQGKLVALSTLIPDGPPSYDPNTPPHKWFGPQPALIDDLNGRIRSIAAEEDVLLVEMHDAFGTDLSLLGGDGLHPSDAGYQRMADVLYDAIVDSFIAIR